MMVELLLSRNLPCFLKTKIVRILFFKRKDHVNKIFSDLGDPGDPFVCIGNADHGFGRFQMYVADLPELLNKVIEQLEAVLRFSCCKGGKRFILRSLHGK